MSRAVVTLACPALAATMGTGRRGARYWAGRVGPFLALALLFAAGCGTAPTAPTSGAAAPAAPAGAAAGAAASAAPTAVAPASFSIGHLPGAAFQWGSYAALEKGFYTAQGLDLDVITIGTPNDAARAVVSNSVAVAHFSADAAVRAIEGGGDLVI